MHPAATEDLVLVLARHGETGHNAEGRWQGQSDPPLNEKGRGQAQQLGTALQHASFDTVVTSDLQRAHDTALACVDDASQLICDPRCREIHLGRWQGIPIAEVFATEAEAAAHHRRGVRDLVRGGSGETLEQVMQRMQAMVTERIELLGPGGRALVVSHGGAIAAAACALMGWNTEQVWATFTPLRNVHCAVLRHRDGRWRLGAWNLPPSRDLGNDTGIG